MQDQLISFQLAKLAKEKGLDLNLSNFYCSNYKGLCTESEEFLLVESLPNVIYDCNNEFDEGERYSSPTQSLLQKWVREKYNLIVLSVPFYDNTSGECVLKGYVYSIFNSSSFEPDISDSDFKTYEDALEAGLIDALNLIIN